jgi:predicted DNA-binding transcriptional regulator AlpA
MNQLQIDSLRDLAIAHLPRANADREQINRYGGTHADFHRRLAVTAVMVRAKAGTTAVEYAAANVLETVSLLSGEHDEALSHPIRTGLLQKLTRDAQELCALTGKVVSWLDALPATPVPEREEESPAPAALTPLPSIAGRFLSTKEAAEVLGYKEQTLRQWASNEAGPIRPVKKVGRHNRWAGDEILALMAKKLA